MLKKVLASCLVFIFCLFNICIATESIYVWSNGSTVTTSNDMGENTRK